ncbi:MAG: hypothetical protein GXO36_06235 [Chloroflexi bacterium]|nr:hypothetical protein [Chloroflexota bacterium]
MSNERRWFVVSAVALFLGFFVWFGLRWLANRIFVPPTPTPPTPCFQGQGCSVGFLIVDRISPAQAPLAYSIWRIELQPDPAPQQVRVNFRYLDGAPQGVHVPLPKDGWKAEPLGVDKLREAFEEKYGFALDGYIMIDFDMWLDMLHTLLERSGRAPQRHQVVEALFSPQVTREAYPKQWGTFLTQSCEALRPYDTRLVWSYWLDQQGVHLLTDISAKEVQQWQQAFRITEETRYVCTVTAP